MVRNDGRKVSGCSVFFEWVCCLQSRVLKISRPSKVKGFEEAFTDWTQTYFEVPRLRVTVYNRFKSVYFSSFKMMSTPDRGSGDREKV